jgi:hypothetical protein
MEGLHPSAYLGHRQSFRTDSRHGVDSDPRLRTYGCGNVIVDV